MKGIFPSLKNCHFVLNHIRSGWMLADEKKKGIMRDNIDLYDFQPSKPIWMSDIFAFFSLHRRRWKKIFVLKA